MPVWKVALQEEQGEDSGINFRILQFHIEELGTEL